MRKLVILTQMPSSFPNEGVLICAENVHKVKQYLGTEHPFAIYDMRAENGIALNLEALAIIAGTIQAHGTLFLVCPQWATLEQEIDADSLRWNDDVAILCPHFYRYFKQLILRYSFEITEQFSLPTSGQFSQKVCQSTFAFTPEQQNIYQNLPLDPDDIHLITAPRGRGKSTLSGTLATKLAQTQSVMITARSHSALPSFWRMAEKENLTFFAPDKLVALVEQKAISAQQWLFID